MREDQLVAAETRASPEGRIAKSLTVLHGPVKLVGLKDASASWGITQRRVIAYNSAVTQRSLLSGLHSIPLAVRSQLSATGET